MRNSSLIPVAALAVVALSGAATASEYRCERADEAVRRVEIAVEDPASGVPCEVVYWKDHEEPGVRRVLWNAQTDAAFCQRKAEALVATLEDGGWVCAAPSPTSRPPTGEAAAERPPSAASAARAPSAPAARDAPAQTEAQDAGTAGLESSPEPAPAERATAARQASERQTRERQTSEQESAIRAALAPQHAPKGPPEPGPAVTPQTTLETTPDAADGPADGSQERTAVTERTALNAIIEQNLVRLNDGVEGQFAAEIGRYGDLDGDGLEDGLVFFTYQSERLGEARFIAAYLYDGDSYALAATKPVAGSDERIQSAEVEAIDGGVISLRLHVLEPGDAACCPSGTRHQTLVLQGGQLVEVRNSASPRSDSPS